MAAWLLAVDDDVDEQGVDCSALRQEEARAWASSSGQEPDPWSAT
jgi:hypothetical protein